MDGARAAGTVDAVSLTLKERIHAMKASIACLLAALVLTACDPRMPQKPKTLRVDTVSVLVMPLTRGHALSDTRRGVTA